MFNDPFRFHPPSDAPPLELTPFEMISLEGESTVIRTTIMIDNRFSFTAIYVLPSKSAPEDET